MTLRTLRTRGRGSKYRGRFHLIRNRRRRVSFDRGGRARRRERSETNQRAASSERQKRSVENSAFHRNIGRRAVKLTSIKIPSAGGNPLNLIVQIPSNEQGQLSSSPLPSSPCLPFPCLTCRRSLTHARTTAPPYNHPTTSTAARADCCCNPRLPRQRRRIRTTTDPKERRAQR